MLVETGKKIFYLSPDTGKESGNISTPDDTQLSCIQQRTKVKLTVHATKDTCDVQ